MELFHPGCTRIVNSFKAVVFVLMLPVLLAACGGGAEAETQASAIPAGTTSPDTTSPSVQITSPSGNTTVSTSTITLSGTASDNVGVTQVTWRNTTTNASGTAAGLNNWSALNIPLQSGSNTLTVTARDATGNQSSASRTVTYNPPPPPPTPDTTAPSVQINNPSGNVTVTTSSIALSGTASDNVGVTQVTWRNTTTNASGTAAGLNNWSVASIPLQSGSNTLTVTARDAAGNQNTDTLTVTYNAPDTTRPTVTISLPTSSATYTTSSSTLSLGGTASDNVGVTQVTWSNSRGGSGSASGTTSWSVAGITLQDGSNTLTVTARDAAGNQNTDTLTVTYNAPVISNSAILTWDAVAATNLSGYRVYYGTSPGSYQQAPGQGLSVGNITAYTLTGLSNGTRYYFAVTAFDTAGNESGYSNEVFKDIP
ncbi:MAG: Ig-like domain-containing protein [Pseudomonadota bacterium]